MIVATLRTILLGLFLALVACNPQHAPDASAVAPASPSAVPQTAPPASAATSRQVMLGLVIPAADIVWGVGSEAPADDAAWEKVQATAVMIAEAGHLLMAVPRVVDQGDWLVAAQAMIDAANAAAASAREKNVDKVSEAGNALYESCDACHAKYMPARQAQ